MAIIMLMALILLCACAAIGLLCVGGWFIGLLISLLIVLLPFMYVVFVIWMLVDCLRRDNISGNERIAWLLVIALLHPIGPFIYYFVGRNTRRSVAPPFAT
jgi:hypothetical protein